MFNSSNTNEYVEELGASYRICMVTGLLLLGAFFYFTFFDPSATAMHKNGTGITSTLVCFAPAVSGAMMLSSESLGTFPETLVTAALILHLLSMIWITIHVVKKVPVPHNAIVLITRVWIFASIGLLILAIVFFLFTMLHNGGSNNDRRR